MPAGTRSPHGRPSFRGRLVRSARLRLLSSEGGHSGDDRATGSYSRRLLVNPHYAAHMAALPQPGRLAHVGGFWWELRQTLAAMWSYKLFGLLMLLTWTVLVVAYILHAGSVTSKKYSMVTEDADFPSQAQRSFKEVVADFFFPTTCTIKENEEVEACSDKEDFKEAECLRHKCCHSPLKTNFRCFIPPRDKPKQMVRIFGICMISVIFLGCLPMYCCSICRRSKWSIALRRKANKVWKIMKKQRKKKIDVIVLESAMEDEEGDEKEQETRALFSD